jgi:hypothetical protein
MHCNFLSNYIDLVEIVPRQFATLATTKRRASKNGRGEWARRLAVILAAIPAIIPT